ncbi:MAG: SRPBCC family protein [Acidimicrobiia bacterium]|jgi:dehydrogenase/reductase SDR family member 12
MTRLHHVITVPRPIGEVFAFVADFSNLPEWDPGISRSSMVGPGPVGTGSEFEVVSSFAGREVVMRYEVVTFDVPHRVVLEGSGSTIRAVDDIEFVEVAGGTEIDYTADLTLRGPLRFVQPLFRPAFTRVGRKAIAGLQTRFGEI